MSVPLHNIYLKCDLVVGPVTVGIRPSLSVRCVSLILGNHLAGQRVTSNDALKTMSPVPACEVIRAMAKRQNVKASSNEDSTANMSNQSEEREHEPYRNEESVHHQESSKQDESNKEDELTLTLS